LGYSACGGEEGTHKYIKGEGKREIPIKAGPKGGLKGKRKKGNRSVACMYILLYI
jgi:hypothetical protein